MRSLLLFAILIIAGNRGMAQIPKKAQDTYNQAMALVAQNKYPEALALFKKATDLYPAYYDAFVQGGIACGKVKNEKDAKFCFTKAIQLKPKACAAYIQYGIFLKEVRGNGDSAFLFFQKAENLRCDTSALLNFNLAWCYNEKNDFEKAIVYLKKSLSIDSVYKNAISELSFSYRKLNQIKEGTDYYKEMYAKTNLDVYMYYVALMYLHIKDKENARLAYDVLEKVSPKMAEAIDRRIKAVQ